ncbi:MAG: hypothetical protein JNN30_04760 [Rhodanobacteraceae bacterium]|nr:hypothetical protein [Rhodanobacteraceae bacterium]
MSRISLLLEQARAGDDVARQQAASLLQDDLKRLARCATTSGLPATLDPSTVAQCCYQRIADGEFGEVQGRAHFLALAGRAMRQRLIDHAREHSAAAPANGEAVAEREAQQLLELDVVLSEFGREDERIVQVIDCRVFGGLTEVETAEALRLPLRTVRHCWARAKERLRNPLLA